jgi:aspartate racemase
MKEKIIGILGGMGPEATRDLFANIIQFTPAKKDQDHLHIIIDNNPKIPDRTTAIVADGEDPVPFMVESGLRLEQSGVNFIVIPCISAHYFIEELRLQLNVPVLSALEEVCKAIKKNGSIITAGLLTTDGTIKGGHFKEKLAEYGLKTLVPTKGYQQHVMKAIYTIKADAEGRKRDQCGRWLKSASDHLIANGAAIIIAGCTEIPLVLLPEDVSVPLYNPLEIIAKAAVEKSKAT